MLRVLTLSVSLLGFLSPFSFQSLSQAQSNSYPYSFCSEETEIPSQELVDSIAFVLNYNYEGEVKSVSPVCYGLNPRMNNRQTWVYTVEFLNNTSLDVAVIETSEGRSISVQDNRKSRDESGWTKWIPLKSPN